MILVMKDILFFSNIIGMVESLIKSKWMDRMSKFVR